MANVSVSGLQISPDQMTQLTIRALVFNGKNFFEWQPSIKNYLASSDDLQYLTTAITDNTTAEVKRSSRNAAIKILNFVSPQIRSMFETEELDAKTLWTEMVEMYESQTTYGIMRLIKKLLEARVGNDGVQFISEFIRTVQQLSSHKVTMDDRIKSMLLIKAIEHKYPALVEAGYTSDYATFLKKVRNKLCLPEQESNHQAYATNNYEQYRKNHFNKPPRNFNNNDRNNPSGWRGNKKKKNFRGRNRSAFATEAEELTDDCSVNESGPEEFAWATVVVSLSTNTRMRPDQVASDSCTSASIMNHDGLFVKESMRPYSAKISGGTGQVFSKAIGRVIVPVRTREGKLVRLKIDNVLYAPEYTANVIKPPHLHPKMKFIFDDPLLFMQDKQSGQQHTIGYRRADGIFMIRLDSETASCGMPSNAQTVNKPTNSYATTNTSMQIINPPASVHSISSSSTPASSTVIEASFTPPNAGDLVESRSPTETAIALKTKCTASKCQFNPPAKLRVDMSRLKFLHDFWGCPCRPIMVEIAAKEGIQYQQFPCDVCAVNNMVRSMPKHRHASDYKPFESLHLDLGTMPCESHNGYKHFLLIHDEASKFRSVLLLREKSDTFREFESWFLRTQKLLGGAVCLRIQSDNGTEFVNKYFERFCDPRTENIEHRKTVVKHSEQNGCAERAIRTIKHIARKLLDKTNLSDRYWSDAVKFAVFVHDRRPNVALNLKCPAEIFFDKPSCDNRDKIIFGSKIYFIEPYVQKEHLNKRPGIFLGYPETTKGYRVLDLEKGSVRIVHDVAAVSDLLPKHAKLDKSSASGEKVQPQTCERFVQMPVPMVMTRRTARLQQPDPHQNDNQPAEQSNNAIATSDPPLVDSSEPNPSRPNEREASESQNDEETIEVEYETDVLTEPIPRNLKELQESVNRKQWLEAIEEELKALCENDCVEVVDRPENHKVLTCRLLLSNKFDEDGRFVRHKSRLVVRGFEQEEGRDYFQTYQPVINQDCFRLFIAIANQFALEIDHVDIKNAYLNGRIDAELYMEIPRLLNMPDYKVWRIKRSIYGLKQAGFLWHKRFVERLLEMGFKQSNRSACLFYHPDRRVFILLYVDDSLVAGSREQISEVKRELSEVFRIRDLRTIRHFLGCKVNYDRTAGKIEISQAAYIGQLAEKYGGAVPKRRSMIPISKSVDLEAAAKGTLMENPSEFRSLVQRLNFVASNTRPDIAVAVNLLSRHAKQPTSELMQIALKVLAYLKTTRGVVLLYERMEQLAFNLYSDASFKRKGAATTIGVACMINGTAFSWDVYKDRKAYTSANEAEFAAVYRPPDRPPTSSI